MKRLATLLTIVLLALSWALPALAAYIEWQPTVQGGGSSFSFTNFCCYKTGQTTSYRTGDDGYYQRGTSNKVAKLTSNGDGTWSDAATGLMWAPTTLMITNVTGITANNLATDRGMWMGSTLYAAGSLVGDTANDTTYIVMVQYTSGGVSFSADRAANPGNFRVSFGSTTMMDAFNSPKARTFNQCCDDAEALKFAGYTDWRAPSMDELMTIWKWGGATGFGGSMTQVPGASAYGVRSSTTDSTSTGYFWSWDGLAMWTRADKASTGSPGPMALQYVVRRGK